MFSFKKGYKRYKECMAHSKKILTKTLPEEVHTLDFLAKTRLIVVNMLIKLREAMKLINEFRKSCRIQNQHKIQLYFCTLPIQKRT